MTTTLEHWAAGAGAGLSWTSCIGANDLNSISNANSVLASSSVITNGTALDVFCDVSVLLGSCTTTGVPFIGVYMYPLNEDGSTYGDNQFTAGTGSAAVPGSQYFKGAIAYPVVTTTALYGNITGLVMPPGSFLFLFQNNLGVTTASSGNVAKYRTYCLGLG